MSTVDRPPATPSDPSAPPQAALSPALAILVAIISFGSSLTLQAAPPPAVSALRVERAPTLDAKLDDPAWREARWQEGFTELETGKPAAAPTRFAVAYDDRCLYVAIRATEPNLDTLEANAMARDSHDVSRDDRVEVFVAPGTQRTDYYQFQVNSKGVVADAAGRQSGTVREASWNSGVKAATSLADGEWIVEMAVPLVDMELGTLTPGDWGINVARVRWAGGSEQLSTFVPMNGSLQQPALFASLALPESDFDVLRWEIAPPTGLSVLREGDAAIVKAKVSVKNLGSTLRPIVLTPRLSQGEKITDAMPVLDILDGGQSKTYEIAMPLPGNGPQRFLIELADRRDPKVLFARRAFPVTLEFKPISLTLREPAYQSAIYATQKISCISGSLGIALSAKELEGSSVEISLSPEDSSANLLAQAKVGNVSTNVEFRLPIPELAQGRYHLKTTLRDGKGKETSSLEQIVRTLAPAPSGVEWRIDAGGILLRNGEPFLPVGWFSLPAAAIDENACNVSWQYWGPWQTVDGMRQRLDEIGAAGGYAVIYPTVNNQRPEELTVAPITEKEAELIRQRVRALKDHPALLAWYLADEPEYHHVLPEAVEQLRALISEEDPWHPTIVVNNSLQGIRRFAQGGDVTAPDPYPFFKQGGRSSSMERVGTFVAEAASCIRPGQTTWVVPQAYDTRDFGGTGERAPTFAESRNMVWQAVGAGARAVVWWDWNWVFPKTIDSVIGNAYLARELAALKSYVLAPVEGGVDFNAPEAPMVRAALRTANGQKALFVTNASTKPQEVVFKVPALAGRELIVLGEGRAVRADADGGFTDRFDVYGTHLYVTDATLATFETLATVQKKIDAGNAARKRPGNLAFEDSGVMPSASSQSAYQPTPIWLVDGMREGRGWSAMPFAGADWVELAWPKPQEIGRLVVYTDRIADCEVLVAPVDEAQPEWRRVASAKAATSNPIELTFEPIESARLRIAVSRLREGFTSTSILEIEAYEE
jgi:hypothetical protein